MPRALLIDDEISARTDLRLLLETHPAVTVVVEAALLGDARALLAGTDYDLVFLDIQLIGGTGFDLVPAVRPGARIIFVTAHDQFALRAFEVNALDYLLKPVDPGRLASAIGRIPDLKPAGAARRTPAGFLHAADKVFVREGERCWFVEVGQIRMLESEGNYTRVHFGDAQPQLFRSLNTMEERLDPKFFFRANRRQIINLSWIAKIEPWFSSGLLVELKGGAKVELSRRQAQEFRERMSL